MPVSSRMLACIAAGLLAASQAPAANAQTVASAMERWGLLGTWATDCTQPPGRAGHLSYVAVDRGRVMHERNFGSSRDRREILMAAVTQGGQIEVFADFGAIGGVRRWVFARGFDGRIRTLENARIDGTDATVVNGRFNDGGDAPWLSRCYQRPSSSY